MIRPSTDGTTQHMRAPAHTTASTKSGGKWVAFGQGSPSGGRPSPRKYQSRFIPVSSQRSSIEHNSPAESNAKGASVLSVASLWGAAWRGAEATRAIPSFELLRRFFSAPAAVSDTDVTRQAIATLFPNSRPGDLSNVTAMGGSATASGDGTAPATCSTSALLEPTWSVEVFQALLEGRSSSIRVPATHQEASAVFWQHPSAICAGCGICILLLIRLGLGFSAFDLPAAIIGAAVWALQEWFIHAKLLHSEWDWAGKRTHEGHHLQPYYHITIDPVSQVAAAMAASLALFVSLAGVPLGESAALAYWSMGLLYVYAHYIVHTRAMPRSKYWRAVRQHHMQHHCRNEGYWLSFCLPAVDTLMATNPPASSVPMTEMAKAAVQKRT